MIRMMILIDRYLPILGGAQKNVHELGTRLMDKGYQVTVLTRKIGKSLKRGEVVDHIPIRRFGWSGNRIFSKITTLLGITLHLYRNRRRYDVIICVPCAYYTDILPAYFSSLITGKPYLIRTTMSGNIDNLLSLTSDSLFEYFKSLIFPPFFFRNILSKAALIITQSPILYERAVSTHSLRNCELVLSGVNMKRYRRIEDRQKILLRTRLGLPLDRLIAVSTGRYIRSKNFMTFIRALELASKHNPSMLHGVILGATEYRQFDSSESEIKDYVRRKGIEDLVSFIDDVTNVEEYLQASDIFVFPTMFDEGMSNSLLEAMACGLPIAASNIPQVAGTFPEGEWLFFEPTRVNELSSHLLRLVESEKLRNELGIRIEEFARANYSSERVAERYDQLIREKLYPDHKQNCLGHSS